MAPFIALLGGDGMGGSRNLSPQTLSLGSRGVHGPGKTICFQQSGPQGLWMGHAAVSGEAVGDAEQRV